MLATGRGVPARGTIAISSASTVGRISRRRNPTSSVWASDCANSTPVGLRFANPTYGNTSCVGQHQDRGDAAGRVGEVLHFRRCQRAGEDIAFTVREPLLQDLVAAEFVAPHRRWHVAPVGVSVQIDVEGGRIV